MARVFILAVALLAAAAAVPAAWGDDLTRGEYLFATRCAVCHGPKGEGARGPTLATPDLLSAPDDESLFRVIRRGISGTEMPGSRLADSDIRQLVAVVRRLGQLPRERLPGDALLGRAIYFGKGACSSCHTISGEGGALGPDLSDVGRRRGAAHLHRSLVDPEAEVPRSRSVYRADSGITQNFLQVRVRTKGGQRLEGVRLNEDTFSIQFRDRKGRIHSLFKSDLAELHKDWGRSLMPSYQGVLSNQELEDLVAYLASLRAGAVEDGR